MNIYYSTSLVSTILEAEHPMVVEVVCNTHFRLSLLVTGWLS